MRARTPFLSLPLLCLVVAACSTPGGGGGPRVDQSLLTAQQLEDLGPGISVYEAIERLRPTWLRDRGTSSPSPAYENDTQAKLHIDQTPYPLDNLRSMRTTDIETIRFISATDATTRYGTGYVNGLIEVRTRLSRIPPG
jgi:hypothetical protein